MKIKNIVFNNFGIKVAALFLAFLVWAMIAGKEHAYVERTVDVNVQYVNVQDHIDVSSVRPDKVRIVVRGTTKEMQKITAEDYEIKFDLKDITESTRLNYFTEDYLRYPENMELVSIHPRMIEITVQEFLTKEVPIRVRYRGNLKPGVILVRRWTVPDKVKIMGYKSRISDIDEVLAAEWVILDELDRSKVIRLALKKGKDILRFEDRDSVDVHVTIETRAKEQEPVDDKR